MNNYRILRSRSIVSIKVLCFFSILSILALVYFENTPVWRRIFILIQNLILESTTLMLYATTLIKKPKCVLSKIGVFAEFLFILFLVSGIWGFLWSKTYWNIILMIRIYTTTFLFPSLTCLLTEDESERWLRDWLQILVHTLLVFLFTILYFKESQFLFFLASFFGRACFLLIFLVFVAGCFTDTEKLDNF